MNFGGFLIKIASYYFLLIKYSITFDSKKKVFLGLELDGRKFIEQKRKNLNGLIIDYIIFENQNDVLEGQFKDNHILINKRIFESSKNYSNYIILHEAGHKNTPSIFMQIHFALVFITGFFAFFLPIIFMLDLIFTFLLFIIGSNVGVLFLFYFLFFVTSICTLLFIIMQYLIEGYAEYFSIKHSSIKSFLEAQKERCEIRFENMLKNKIKASFIKKCFIIYYTKLSYPDPKLVIWVYKKINNIK